MINDKVIKVASCPASSGLNSYVDLFYRALSCYKINLACELQINDKWLHDNAQSLDAIHIHWPEDIWRTRGKGSWINKINGIIGLWRFLGIAKKYKLIRIWTAHNIEHHEGIDIFDRIGYFIMSQQNELIVVHNEYARSALLKRSNIKGECVVMPHGNYDGAYPQQFIERNDLLTDLGLSKNKITLLCVGNVRDYKGYDLACKALEYLTTDYQLIIAGKPLDHNIEHSIRELAAHFSDRVALILDIVPTQLFVDLFNACDVVLLPYKKITGSGVLLTAFSLGKGVVTSNLPPFCELLENDWNAGVVFESGSAESLAHSIINYFKLPTVTHNMAARKIADLYSWDVVVKPFVSAIFNIRNNQCNSK